MINGLLVNDLLLNNRKITDKYLNGSTITVKYLNYRKNKNYIKFIVATVKLIDYSDYGYIDLGAVLLIISDVTCCILYYCN